MPATAANPKNIACRSQLLNKTIQTCTERLSVVCDDWPDAVRAGVRLAVAVLTAGFGGAAAADDGVALSVKPVLCITDSREDACALSISVSWQSDAAGAYCLHNDLVEEPIRCWRGTESGTVEEERVIRETFNYWLTDGDSDTRIAEATVEVMTTDSDDRRRNRRRRHVWNIL